MCVHVCIYRYLQRYIYVEKLVISLSSKIYEYIVNQEKEN